MNDNHPAAAAVPPERGGEAADELNYRLRQQQLTAEFARIALTTHELATLLQEATRLCALGLQSELAKVMEYLPEERCFVVRAGVGWNPGVVGIGRAGADAQSPAGYAFKTGMPVISNHLSAETRFHTPTILAEHGVKRAINVLIQGDGDRFGILEVDSRSAGRFTDADLAFMQGFAHLLGIAIERQRIEEALRVSETPFRLMVDAVPQIVWITDRDGRMEYLNRRFVDYTGACLDAWTPAEVAANFVHPEDGVKVVSAFKTALETGEPFEIEHRIRSALGEHRWFLARAEPYRDPGSAEIVRWFGASVDIHDRKLAEAALRELNDTLERRVVERTVEVAESQRHFRGIFDSAFQFMALLTLDGRVVEVNQTALAWSAIEPSDIIGKPFWLAAPMRGNTELQEEIESGIRRAAAGKTVRAEYVMRGAGEVRATVDFSIKPVLSDGGEPSFLVAEGRDVTALKEAQEALRQSQKMEAMGALTGGVAHDFNNLLTPILGSLDLLQRKGVGGERERRLIDGALQSAERAKMLVQRLLAFARRQPLQPTAVDAAKLVENMAGLIGSTLGPTIVVRLDLALDLPPARADANQLEMALLNLAVNARDAMPEGGDLTIAAQQERVCQGHSSVLPEGDYVRLGVRDTGVGMDRATLKRAVEPFFSTKGVGQGTGLGLSMVHGLTAQLGGALTIKSAPGEGTTVELWLPISPAAAGGEQPDIEYQPIAAGRGTALLVDDEVLVRMGTADMLADFGYEVVEAGSAEEALHLIREGLHPDLLLTDHLMPGMNGAELVRVLKVERPALPALIVSGYTNVEGIDRDVARLTKPFRSAELAASLSALMLSPD